MLIKQGYDAPILKSSLHKFYGRHHNLDDHYEISIFQMTMDLTFYVDVFFPLSLIRLYPDLTVDMSNTAGVLSEAETTYPSRAPEFTLGFLVGSVLLIVLVVCVCCPIKLLYVLSSVTISAWKRCSVHFYPPHLQLFVGGRRFNLRFLCLFAHSGVQHILYCVSFCFSSSFVDSFSGLSFFYWPFGIL